VLREAPPCRPRDTQVRRLHTLVRLLATRPSSRTRPAESPLAPTQDRAGRASSHMSALDPGRLVQPRTRAHLRSELLAVRPDRRSSARTDKTPQPPCPTWGTSSCGAPSRMTLSPCLPVLLIAYRFEQPNACASAAGDGWRGVCCARRAPPCRRRDTQARRLHTLVRQRPASAGRAANAGLKRTSVVHRQLSEIPLYRFHHRKPLLFRAEFNHLRVLFEARHMARLHVEHLA
jgi:hypothetical protein